MAAPGTAVGLSGADLEQIRDGLQSGRKPKVIFTASAGQVAGQVGQIVGLTDPEVSEEWILVRFGNDELPFSPADLAIPPKSLRRSGAPPAPEFKLGSPPPVPTPREEPRTMKPAGATTPSPAKPAVAASNGAPGNGAPGNGAATNGSGEGRKPPGKSTKLKPPASLTVTLAYADREWTVAANLGTKALAKPYVIRPAEALRMVSLLDVPGVHDAVESIIAAERVEAEDRARRLREELADIETRLSELTGRG